MTAELKGSRTRLMMLLTSRSWAGHSVPCLFPGGTSILGGWWGGGLAPKFASEIRVRAPSFVTKNIGEKYHKFCPLNFRYDPKIRVEDLREFSSALYSLVTFKVTSKQII